MSVAVEWQIETIDARQVSKVGVIDNGLGEACCCNGGRLGPEWAEVEVKLRISQNTSKIASRFSSTPMRPASGGILVAVTVL
ncbi:hypothetical protein L1887_20405 [Cichorium endivia]|nr:hypothetical protein L1887_20405 [Cichorium endivia]